MSDIILHGVTKSFGDNTVLKIFSHMFHEGTVTCIEGPSGCGKTTLLNLIAGIEKPDTGEISGVPEKIAFVFQEDRLAEEFSAISNIRLVCGRRKSKSDIAEHLAELNLSDIGNKPVREYSGGMKRRVAIARAICCDSDCILLDEPFKGLDDELRKAVMDYVLRHTAGKTVIFVTHDPCEADYFGGTVLTLKKQNP